MEFSKITDAEREIMNLLWDKSPQTANEIIVGISEQKQWSEQTVKVFLNRLHKKGAISFEKRGRTYLYTPIISKEEYYSTENKTFLQRMYNGAVGLLFSQFLAEESLSEEEIEELEQMLKQKRADFLKNKPDNI